MNYRVNGNRQLVDTLLRRQYMEVMLSNDQLNIERRRGNVFKGFVEGSLTFPPTYKYDAGTDVFDTSPKQRVPSWTDRILYKARKEITLEHYDSVPAVKSSDHKPVFATFSVLVNQLH